MEQTFADRYIEHKRQAARSSFGFVLWLYIETGIGILKEYWSLIMAENMMKNNATDLRAGALIGFVLVLPFMLLEAMNNSLSLQDAPGFAGLFGILWLVPALFIVILLPLVRTVRAGNTLMANPFTLVLKVAFLLLLAALWVAFLADQMPCFLGVPNCD